MFFRAPLILLAAFSASILLPCSPVALARETDQFTTPRAPLPDFGPELSRKVVEIIESDRTGEDPDRVLAKWVGRNFFSSRLVRWMGKIQVPEGGPRTFRPGVFASIYRCAISPLPASFVFNAPTVRVHGYYMGSDKLDHFFQQGHLYFEMVMRRRERDGVGEAEAIAAVVAHGVAQEHKYFGTAVSGVYSNADLAANYAGMKFYLNLRHPVRIGERVLPPLFERSGEGWRLRAGVDRDRLLQPFLSNHLDESLNPSRYRFSRKSIRAVIRARCDAWRQFYSGRLDSVAPAGRGFAAKWFGEEYGHWLPPSDEVSIATVCGPVGGESMKSRNTETLSRYPPSKQLQDHIQLALCGPPAGAASAADSGDRSVAVRAPSLAPESGFCWLQHSTWVSPSSRYSPKTVQLSPGAQ